MVGWLLQHYVRGLFEAPRAPSQLERIGARAMQLHDDVRDAAELFCMVVPPNEDNVPALPAKGE